MPAPRRRPNSSTPRTHRHVINLTLEEDAALQALADEYGVTISRFLWEASMSPHPALTPDQLRARKEFSMIIIPWKNLAEFTNQCARIANTEKRFPPEAEQIYPMYIRLRNELERILDRI